MEADAAEATEEALGAGAGGVKPSNFGMAGWSQCVLTAPALGWATPACASATRRQATRKAPLDRVVFPSLATFHTCTQALGAQGARDSGVRGVRCNFRTPHLPQSVHGEARRLQECNGVLATQRAASFFVRLVKVPLERRDLLGRGHPHCAGVAAS